MIHKEVERKTQTVSFTKQLSKVRVSICRKSESRFNKAIIIVVIITNKNIIDISNETLIETLGIFQITKISLITSLFKLKLNFF